MDFELYRGDCLDVMKDIPDGSVDMILTDPPYGTTACKWDSIIPLEPMWDQLKRIIKPNGAIVMTAAQPFTSILVCSNLDMHKYNLVWRKSKICHFAQAPYRFLTEHEDVVVFSFGGTSKNAKNRMIYNPQGLSDCNKVCKGKSHSAHRPSSSTQADYLQAAQTYQRLIDDGVRNGTLFYNLGTALLLYRDKKDAACARQPGCACAEKAPAEKSSDATRHERSNASSRTDTTDLMTANTDEVQS